MGDSYIEQRFSYSAVIENSLALVWTPAALSSTRPTASVRGCVVQFEASGSLGIYSRLENSHGRRRLHQWGECVASQPGQVVDINCDIPLAIAGTARQVVTILNSRKPAHLIVQSEGPLDYGVCFAEDLIGRPAGLFDSMQFQFANLTKPKPSIKPPSVYLHASYVQGPRTYEWVSNGTASRPKPATECVSCRSDWVYETAKGNFCSVCLPGSTLTGARIVVPEYSCDMEEIRQILQEE